MPDMAGSIIWRSNDYGHKFCRLAVLLATLVIWGCDGAGNIRTTPQMDAEERFWVRVLLLDDANTCEIRIRSPYNIEGAAGQSLKGQAAVVRSGAKVEIAAGRIAVGGETVTDTRVVIAPAKPYVFTLNGNDYRGKLELKANPDGRTFDAINHVPLEAYLAGVIGAEMPDYWEPEALKAQTIAARTYCLYIKKMFGGKRDWDLSKTAAHQVYTGIKGESAQVWDAVNRTTGHILICDTGSSDEIFPTYYSSACGGHTEPSKNVFGDSFGPLSGSPCPYCRDVAKPDIFYWPMVQFERKEVTNRLFAKYPKLKQLGDITEITPAKQSDYDDFSRLTLVKLTGSDGTSDSMRAEDLRLTVDPSGAKLRSISCKIAPMGDKWVFLSGRGYGHGVGLCQCGAEGMARQGKKSHDILSHYYPGAKFARVY